MTALALTAVALTALALTALALAALALTALALAAVALIAVALTAVTRFDCAREPGAESWRWELAVIREGSLSLGYVSWDEQER